jgi:hypothetical protein
MAPNIYLVTQERLVTVLANSPGEATRKAIKAFDNKECTIRETVKKEK